MNVTDGLGGGSAYNAAEQKKKKKQQILDDKNLNIWQKKHLLEQMEGHAKPWIPGGPAGLARLDNTRVQDKPKLAPVKNPFTYLNKPDNDSNPPELKQEASPSPAPQPDRRQWLMDRGVPLRAAEEILRPAEPEEVPEPVKAPEEKPGSVEWLVGKGVPREAAIAISGVSAPAVQTRQSQHPLAEPGSVEWLVGKGVPREAAKQIADPGPSKFNPQPGTVDWLMERGVPRQAADVIAREPDPIRPDRYYWQRKKEILENPDMSLPMKEYLLGLLEDRYHTPMNKPSVVDETSGALAEYVTPTKFEIIEATIRKNGEVTQQDMEDLGIGTGMGASVAADMFNRQFTLASDYGLSFQDVVMQFALSQGDQGAAYTAYRLGQVGSSLVDRLLAGSPDQRLPDKPMNLVDKGKGGGDNGGSGNSETKENVSTPINGTKPIPDAKRLSQYEQDTAGKVMKQKGITLKEYPDDSYDYYDPKTKQVYDQMGNPRASQYWNEKKFLGSIDDHLNKSNSITIIDLNGFTEGQIVTVEKYVSTLPAESIARIWIIK